MAYSYGLPSMTDQYPYISPASLAYGAPQVPQGNGDMGMDISPVPMAKPAAIAQAAQQAAVNPDTTKQSIWGKDGFTLNSISDIASIIGGFGTLWNGIQANRLAKDAFNFQKQAYQTNLANTIKSYNTSLTDRARSRYAQYGQGAGAADAYIADNRLEG